MNAIKKKPRNTEDGNLIPASRVGAIIQLSAGHDVNGNPRRGYLILSKRGDAIGYTDAGYEGSGALVHVLRLRGETRMGYGLPYSVPVKTTPAELRDWRNTFGNN